MSGTQADDSMDGGGRATSGTQAENNNTVQTLYWANKR